MSAERDGADAPWEWLYAATASGMWAISAARFEIEVVGPSFPRVARGQVWVSTHRAETDVPVIIALLWTRGGMWRRGAARIHFAARDDLFEPGVVNAGLRLPGPIARLAWPLTPGWGLRHVRVHPVRRPTGAKLTQIVAELPDDKPLHDLLGERLSALLAARAADLGRPAPRVVRDIRDPAYARQLWEDVERGDLAAGAQDLWHRHVARAAGDLRRIVRAVRDGAPLLLFPEGRVSPDGDIGPVGEILDTVARAGRVESLVPLALAYDPLRPRRAAVTVAAGSPAPPGDGDLVAGMLATLRSLTPVTCGQVVARVLVTAAGSGDAWILRDALAEELDETVARALEERRPVSGSLASRGPRRARLDAALQTLRRRSCLRDVDRGAVVIDPARVLADDALMRLAAEDRAMWRPPERVPPPA